jgi:D-tyrosyl-tRNA(Tyr) deacylase
MNHSVRDVNGEILLISQFTLMASTKKGNRPSYTKSANRRVAIPLYESLVMKLEEKINFNIKTGVFGANMEVRSVNDGPVNIYIDSKKKE